MLWLQIGSLNIVQRLTLTTVSIPFSGIRLFKWCGSGGQARDFTICAGDSSGTFHGYCYYLLINEILQNLNHCIYSESLLHNHFSNCKIFTGPISFIHWVYSVNTGKRDWAIIDDTQYLSQSSDDSGFVEFAPRFSKVFSICAVSLYGIILYYQWYRTVNTWLICITHTLFNTYTIYYVTQSLCHLLPTWM